MDIRHKIWLEKEGKVLFGPGRDALLKAIDRHHSLNAAAKSLNMSYRAAWGRLRASEERLGVSLVASDGTGRGMHLTPQGRHLIGLFDRLENEIGQKLLQASAELRESLE